MCTSGCGCCAATASMRERQPDLSSTSPFQYTPPPASIASCTFSGLVMFGSELALGRSTFTAWVSSGAVMMKMTSSTSITSMSGIMLISAIGAWAPLLLNPPNAISGRFPDLGAGRQHGVQVVSERIQAREHDAVGAHEGVVGEHRGNRNREAERRHDERLAYRTGHLVEGALAGKADVHERVVDAPHGAEQADERCRRAHGSERRQPRLMAHGLLVHHAAHGAGEKFAVALAARR